MTMKEEDTYENVIYKREDILIFMILSGPPSKLESFAAIVDG